MELRMLNKDELVRIYNDEMVYDFPKAELKPVKGMLHLMDLGKYEPLAVEEAGELIGYATVWLPPERNGALLEYFGVLRGKRCAGFGTTILHLLERRYGQIFGEVECPDSDDPEENALRHRRIGFYLRNGLRVLDYECALFGVHFNCLYLGPEQDDRKVEALHRSVYADYFSEGHMAKYIQLPLHPGEKINPAPEWVEEE